MTILKGAWESYLREVVPRNAGETQRIETENAFYAGALSVFSAILSGLSGGTEPTQADEEMMLEISRELEQFKRRMNAKAAEELRRRMAH